MKETRINTSLHLEVSKPVVEIPDKQEERVDYTLLFLLLRSLRRFAEHFGLCASQIFIWK